MAERVDFLIVGGGSAGCALANRLTADPSTRVLVLEAGRPDYRWDIFIHMPAALAFPIGNRFYDWKYESEPEPHMNGRRIYHARGKVLGGSSCINGMIFQRGNPLDYERWAADPGMETWDYAHCLPYFKRMETLPRRRATSTAAERRSARARARAGRRPALRRVLRSRPAGRLPAHRRRQRLPAGGLRAVRPQHPPRPPPERGARVPPPGDGPAEPRGALPRALDAGRCSTAHARSASSTCGTARSAIARASEVILCGGAINSPQLLQLSGVGNAGGAARRSASTSCTSCPASARTCRTTSRSTSSTRCTQPVSMQPALQKWRRPLDRLPVAVPATRARRDEPLRGRRVRPLATTTSRIRT